MPIRRLFSGNRLTDTNRYNLFITFHDSHRDVDCYLLLNGIEVLGMRGCRACKKFCPAGSALEEGTVLFSISLR